MAKMFKKLFAMMLVLCMLMSMLPVQALAEEAIVTPKMETTIDTSEETPVVVVSIEPAAEAVPEETEEGTEAPAEEAETTEVAVAAEETEAAPAEEAAEEEVESGLTTEETFEENYGFAEEGVEVDEEKITIEENVVESTETEINEEGNTVVTETVETETAGTIEEGAFEGVVEGTIEGEEIYTEVTEITPEGEEIGSAWTQEGEETLEYVTEEAEGEVQPDVTVELIPGETTEATSDPVTEVTGDVAEGVDDTEYDYTETTTTDRTVTAETSEVETTVNDADTGLVGEQETQLKGLDPVYDEDDDLHINPSNGQPLDKVNGEHVGKEDVFDRNYLSMDAKYKDTSKWDIPEGAEFRYVGTGEHSKFFNARVTVVYAKDENGDPIVDENGNYVIEAITKKDGTIVTIDGVPATELPDGVSLKPIFDDYNGGRPNTFMLMDKHGNKVYAYCCDMDTDAKKGTYYDVQNLEDSDYYASEESEENIRSIVMNGYWGTSDVQKEDGTYEIGSLEKIKQGLREAINSGKMENEVIQMPAVDADGNPIVDEEGNPVMESKTMLELIDDMTEGEALLATQSAIWSFSNGSIATQNGKDGVVVIDPDGYKWNQDPTANSKDGEALNDYGSARVDFLYKWLIALETEEESTIVINEKNFVEDVSLTVHEKVEDAERNNDEDQTNDVYNTDLNFKLAFIPGPNDDLLVQVTYTDFEGNVQNVVRRLAGENGEGQSYEDIRPGEDGSYVIKGLKLSENEDFNFDLRLEGTQYLEEGVYVYQAVGGRDVSQTFVGIAEGTRNVDVSMGVTIKFDVDESNHVVATRRWHNEGDPRAEIEQQDPPTRYRYTAPETIIEEEPVPLADVPQTGDNSILWFALILMSGCALCILKATEKKCKA